MKRFLVTTLAAATLFAVPAYARDTVLDIPLADVLAMPEAQGKLDGTIKFYLAGQSTPKVQKNLGSDISNPKTNGLGKSDEFGCKWAALTALLRFQDTAKEKGANAVVNIVSFYKRNETKSATTIQCHAGTFVIGLTLKGDYAKIGK